MDKNKIKQDIKEWTELAIISAISFAVLYHMHNFNINKTSAKSEQLGAVKQAADTLRMDTIRTAHQNQK